MYEKLIKQFIAERKSQGISQKELSNICDVALSTITKVEVGVNSSKLKTFMEMCRGLGFMVIMIPIPDIKKPEPIVEEVIEEEVIVDYDNWEETS